MMRSIMGIVAALSVAALIGGCVTLKAKNYSEIGSQSFSKENFAKSAQYLEKAAAIAPDNAGYLTALGWSYFKLGKYDEAILVFERLAQVDPKSLDAYTGRGWSNFKKLYFDAAIYYFEEALRIDPENSDAYCGIGWCSLKKLDEAAAMKNFNIALRKGMKYVRDGAVVTDPEAHRGLGYLYFQKGDYKTALGHFKNAVILSPGWNDARVKWGDCLFSLKKYRDAISVYRYALQRARTAELYGKIGWCHYYLENADTVLDGRLRHLRSARRMLEKALAIDPAYAGVSTVLAEINAKLAQSK